MDGACDVRVWTDTETVALRFDDGKETVVGECS